MRMTTGLMFAVLALLAVDARGADDVVNERVPKQGLDAGKAAYLANCAACHQPEGTGPARRVPAARAVRLHRRESKRTSVLEVVLRGISGKMVVNGVEYNNVMPAMSYLSDDDLADIITFV